MEVGLEPVVRPRHQHVPNLDDDGARLGRQGREDVAHGEARVGGAPGANLEPVLAVALEQERQAANVGVAAGAPGTDAFGGGVVGFVVVVVSRGVVQ